MLTPSGMMSVLLMASLISFSTSFAFLSPKMPAVTCTRRARFSWRMLTGPKPLLTVAKFPTLTRPPVPCT